MKKHPELDVYLTESSYSKFDIRVKAAVTDTRRSYLSKRLKLAYEAQANNKYSHA